MRTYYSLIDSQGYVELSQFTTDPYDPKGGLTGRRLLPDTPPAHDPLTQKVNRLEPIPPSALAVPYEVVNVEPTVPEGITKITKRAFRDRFTMEEKVAIELASLDDPAASLEVRAQKAALRVYLKDTEAASFIDLGNAALIGGMQSLVAMGLLTQARADAILTTPVTADEV